MSSKRQMGCKAFHMGLSMGLHLQLPSLIPASSSGPRSVHVGRAGCCCHLPSPVGGWDPGRGADLQRRARAGAVTLAKEVRETTLPASGPYGRRAEGTGLRRALRSRLYPRPAGPGGAPGPRLRRPALWRATRPATAPAGSRAAQSPGPHPP